VIWIRIRWNRKISASWIRIRIRINMRNQIQGAKSTKNWKKKITLNPQILTVKICMKFKWILSADKIESNQKVPKIAMFIQELFEL